MAERPTSFPQQEILAPLDLTKEALIYVAKKLLCYAFCVGDSIPIRLGGAMA